MTQRNALYEPRKDDVAISFRRFWKDTDEVIQNVLKGNSAARSMLIEHLGGDHFFILGPSPRFQILEKWKKAQAEKKEITREESFLLGCYELGMKNYEGAKKLLLTANFPESYLLVGDIEVTLRNDSEAFKSYKKAIQLGYFSASVRLVDLSRTTNLIEPEERIYELQKLFKKNLDGTYKDVITYQAGLVLKGQGYSEVQDYFALLDEEVLRWFKHRYDNADVLVAPEKKEETPALSPLKSCDGPNAMAALIAQKNKMSPKVPELIPDEDARSTYSL
jgi:TPR repeat protein